MATPEDVKTVESPRIPDHDLIRLVGKGAYGEVWLGRSVMGVYRGVKIVYRKTFTDSRPFEREFDGIRNFEPISRQHAGVISILHVGRNDQLGYFYYIMEAADDLKTGQKIRPESYVPRTISAELRQRGRFATAECILLGSELTSALAHLHRHGLIHRDIKPSNIIFVNGQAKLADIGLVTEIGEQKTQVGTPPFMPPEGPGTPLADIYGLGKVLYQLAVGKEVEQFPALPTTLAEDPDLPAFLRLNEVILKACERNSRGRYQSAEEMHAALVSLQSETGPRARAALASGGASPATAAKPQRMAILCEAHAPDDARLLRHLTSQLRARGMQVFHDERSGIGVAWARDVEKRIREADAVLILLTAASVQSEMMAYEIELAHQAAEQQKGRPLLLPVRVQFTDAFPDPLRPFLDRLRCFLWKGPEDDECLFSDLSQALETSQKSVAPEAGPRLESIGGAVPLDSQFYVVRPTDYEFQTAIARRDSIVLVKGARQMGKTSLLARGLQQARQTNAKVVLSDLQKLSPAHLASASTFFLALSEFLADQLNLEVLPGDVWDARRSPNTNFERYLRREVLGKLSHHVVWGLDEVDRLFACEFGSEVFGLFRSWHNERALDPGGPWSCLTLAIAYATEAHLFISDINQSPFNVGTRLILDDFNLDQVRDLNERYGVPLKGSEALLQFFAFTGGQPYLVRRGLNEMAASRTGFAEWSGCTNLEEGVFGDHLRRILVLLAKDEELLEVVRGVLRGQPCPASSFYRLRSSGVLTGDSPQEARLRCELYARYLRGHLAS
jgi:hypothetical protein